MKISEHDYTLRKCKSKPQQGWGLGEMHEGGQKIQISIYKISHRNVMYSMATVVNKYCIAYLKVARRVEL